MIYYLLANNNDIQQSHIDQIDLDNYNVIVLFNHMIPMKFDRVRNYSKKYLIARLNIELDDYSLPYAGTDKLTDYKNSFSKIFFHPCEDSIGEKYKEIHKKYLRNVGINNSVIECMESQTFGLKDKLKYPRFKNMSTGLIVYNYIRSIKNTYDKICLVGFTSQICVSYHSASWEAKFFREERIKENYYTIW